MRRKIASILITVIFSCNVFIIAGAALEKNHTEFISREVFPAAFATDSDIIKATNANSSKTNEMTKTKEKKDGICNVSFPTDIRACIDPGNLKGKGQIFSDSYVVENYGKNDIAIKIKNIQIMNQNGEEMQSFFDDKDFASDSNAKKLNIEMIWKNETERTERSLTIENGSPDKYVLFLKGAKYNKSDEFISLNESSKGLFYFTGALDPDFITIWEKNGLIVKFDYEIEIEETEDDVEEE